MGNGGTYFNSSCVIAFQIKPPQKLKKTQLSFLVFALKKQGFAVSLKILITLPFNCFFSSQCYA